MSATRIIQKSLARQEGQALVLACLTVLILSIAVITTVNLGHTVHEKIRLQNTADAAAYSMAAMEARAFNFYAFANRAQASHYVNAMIFHSTLSFFYWLETFLNDMFGVIKTMYPCASPDPPFWTIICPLLRAVPFVGPLLGTISQVLQTVRRILAGLNRTVFRPSEQWLDNLVGKRIIPGYKYLQSFMAGASQAMMWGTASHLINSSLDVIQANDQNLEPGFLTQMGVGLLNECMFSRTMQPEVNGNLTNTRSITHALDPRAQRDDDPKARAKRTMGQIANASRYSCETSQGLCRPYVVTNRTISATLTVPSWLQPVRFILDDFILRKWGQTRLLGHGTGNGTNLNWIHTNAVNNNQSSGPLGSGDNMGADDLYDLQFPPGVERIGIPGAQADNPFNCRDDDDIEKCHGDPRHGRGPRGNRDFGDMFKNSIWAMNANEAGFRGQGGIHYRLAYGRSHMSCSRPSCGFEGARDKSGMFGTFGGVQYPDGNDLGLNKFKHELVRVLVVSVEIDHYVANVRGVQDGNHPWFGVMPFPHFEPGQFASACPSHGGRASLTQRSNREREFNQPSTFVALNKDAAMMRNAVEDGTGATRNEPALNWGGGNVGFSFSGGSNGELKLENKLSFGIGPLSAEGLMVVSRGQTYYHRPGNWQEQPNFFNPYWRPRLASVWQGRYQIPLIDQAARALPPQIANFGQKIITH